MPTRRCSRSATATSVGRMGETSGRTRVPLRRPAAFTPSSSRLDQRPEPGPSKS